MTQLMLFDAPASVSVATAVAPVSSDRAAANDTAAEKNRRPLSNRSRTAPSHSPRRRPDGAGEKRGMHHMGDLARLVLMRYELVHRRRAALAQRQARCAG